VSARLNPDGGLPYLEAKLGVFTHGPSHVRRNAALDILTGRVVDYRLRPVPAMGSPDGVTMLDVIRQGSRSRVRNIVALSTSALPAVDWSTRLYASPWLAASDEPPVRLRIVRTSPNLPSARWHMPPWLLAVGAAGVLLGAGFELRAFTDRTPAVQPTAVPVEAQAPAPDAILIEAPAAAAAVEVVPTAIRADTVSALAAPAPLASPPAPVPASEFGLLLDEGFTSNARHWPDDPHGTAWLGGGAYHLAGRQATQFVAVGIPGTQNLADSVVTGWFRKVGGPDGGGYGLILRDQEPQARDGRNQLGHYYVFEAGDRGQVGLWLRDGDHWVDLLTWTPSDAVRRGTASNELTVSAIGDHLSFLVNGVPVASQTDTVWHSGAVGVFVGGDGNEVALDRVAVRVAR